MIKLWLMTIFFLHVLFFINFFKFLCFAVQHFVTWIWKVLVRSSGAVDPAVPFKYELKSIHLHDNYYFCNHQSEMSDLSVFIFYFFTLTVFACYVFWLTDWLTDLLSFLFSFSDGWVCFHVSFLPSYNPDFQCGTIKTAVLLKLLLPDL